MPKKKSTRRKDGRFQAKAHGKYFYSTVSQADADRKAAAYRKQIQDGLSQDARKITVAQYAADWLPLHKAHVSINTYNGYAILLDKVISSIGHLSFPSVRPDDAKRFFVEKMPPKKHPKDRNGYCGGYIRKAKTLCVDLFDSAIENGLCVRNPFRSKSAQPEYGEDGTHREITEEERNLILASNHWFKPAVMVMLYAGLRRGEALAVNCDKDVDEEISWLSVNTAIRFVRNTPVIVDPKTNSGKRVIPIFQELRPYLDKSGLLVSARKSGKEMTQGSFESAWASYVFSVECQMNNSKSRQWYGLDKKAREENPEKYARIQELLAKGMKEEADRIRLSDWKRFTVRPHDLRHSFCTMCRDAGVDIKQTMAWMGHADSKMILKIYDHPGKKRAEDSIKKVENMLQS